MVAASETVDGRSSLAEAGNTMLIEALEEREAYEAKIVERRKTTAPGASAKK